MTEDGGRPELRAELMARVGAVADEVLWPMAQAVDGASSLPAEHFEAISRVGLFSMAAPQDLGGLGLGPAESRQVLRRLGSGCGATAFAFTQHHGVVAALARTENRALRQDWLARLCDATLAGIAFAHVRRPGPATVRAQRERSGWRVDGEAPWATSWGRAEVFLVAATTDDDQLLWFLIPGCSSDRVTASDPLGLVVFGATATVRIRFDGLLVPDSDVVELVPRAIWQVGDRRAAARPSPLCLGVGDRALALLGEAAPATADALRELWAEAGRRAEEAALAVDHQSDDVAAVAAVRAETVFAVQRLTTALLAAAGGQGAELRHPAQRLAREALFYVVQAQNEDGRQATLKALAGPL